MKRRRNMFEMPVSPAGVSNDSAARVTSIEDGRRTRLVAELQRRGIHLSRAEETADAVGRAQSALEAWAMLVGGTGLSPAECKRLLRAHGYHLPTDAARCERCRCVLSPAQEMTGAKVCGGCVSTPESMAGTACDSACGYCGRCS